MSNQPLGDRSNYQRGRLDANDLLPDPVDLFHRWVNEAIAEQIPEPLAAALATADSAGNPSVRMILIRGIGPAGIDFYTNHESRKGRDLAASQRPPSPSGGRRSSDRCACQAPWPAFRRPSQPPTLPPALVRASSAHGPALRANRLPIGRPWRGRSPLPHGPTPLLQTSFQHSRPTGVDIASTLCAGSFGRGVHTASMTDLSTAEPPPMAPGRRAGSSRNNRLGASTLRPALPLWYSPPRIG